MDTFTDYYAVLGVDANASASSIKAAFKKLALQYHPDVYKGEDAQERMRLLLLAYQTLCAAAFVGATRYRIAWDFLLAVLAAAALDRAWTRWRAR